ncbi:MAG: aminotransferase class I/II-fold pyridoxal phosphate-dependent enzyme, partial [Candidatus Sumerlaeia bacterium]|nr:aminotransferase class I/II-fold pyridoxal phosphate-dependent enzyme [Candidatus Sumerlaeia bacterium]
MNQEKLSQRVQQLPKYVFVGLAEKKRQALDAGKRVIDLSIGDPDLPTPKIIVEALKQAVEDKRHHCYPPGIGYREFREAAARFYQRRFGVELDPQTEVISVIGTKEGLAHLPLILIDPGDVALVPEPAYPVYSASVMLAGGKVVTLPLSADTQFLPALEQIPPQTLKQAKILYLNYPNNPSGALATQEFFSYACDQARHYGFIICHDAAYADVYFNTTPPPSILAIPGAKEVAIEFYSLSKTFNMTGWRIGFVAGNRQIIEALGRLKGYLDSGIFGAVQVAGITALDNYERLHPEIMKTYKERREILVRAIRQIGWQMVDYGATYYCWVKCPAGI